MDKLIHELTITYIEKSLDTTDFSEDDFVKLYLRSYDAINESYSKNHKEKEATKFFKK